MGDIYSGCILQVAYDTSNLQYTATIYVTLIMNYMNL